MLIEAGSQLEYTNIPSELLRIWKSVSKQSDKHDEINWTCSRIGYPEYLLMTNGRE